MQEILFLVVLMVVTALGVRLFLNQMNGAGLRLPRLRLPGLRGLSLPRVGRRGSGRRRRPAALEDEEDLPLDDGMFSASASPYAMPPVLSANVLASSAPDPSSYGDEDEEYDDDEDEDDDLTAHQIDFFSDAEPGGRRVVRFTEPTYDDASTPASESSGAAEANRVAGTADLEGAAQQDEAAAGVLPEAEAAPVFEVAAAEPDPDDLMSFFEKASVTSQLPEALRDVVEEVSAGELLSEAQQLRDLMRRGAA